MPTNGGPGGDGDGGNIRQQQFNLLGATQLVNFSANPSPVKPFGTTTLSWEVRFSPLLHAEVTVVVAGSEVHGRSPGTLSGSATVTLDQTTFFTLTAKTPLAQRTLFRLSVPLEESECKPTSFPTFIVTERIEQGINQALQGRLRNPAKATPDDVGNISIAMTLKLQGSDIMDVSMLLFVGRIGGQVSVTAPSVVANVHLSGLASFCESACSQIAQALLTEIANNQIVPSVQQGLNDEIQQAAAAAKMADPQHRDFALTSFTFDSIEVSFVICPTGTGGA